MDVTSTTGGSAPWIKNIPKMAIILGNPAVGLLGGVSMVLNHDPSLDISK